MSASDFYQKQHNASVSNFHSSTNMVLSIDRSTHANIYSFFVNMPNKSIRLIDKTCVKNSIFAMCWNLYDPFALTLISNTQNYIIVLNNRFKGFGGSI